MRAPSAMAMGVCAGLVASLGTRLVGRRVGLRAGLVFALLPIVSRYGQEARPYALAAMFATLSSLLLLRLLERPGQFARAACYAAALTGLGLTHLLALLVLPAHLACCVRFTRDRPFLVIDRRTFPRVALAAGVGVGFVLLLVFAGARQRSAQIGRGGSLPELVGLASRSISHATLGALVLGAIVVVLALRQAFASRQPILLRLWAVLPPVVLLSTYPVLHLWAMRYVVFTLPAIVLLVANAIEPLTARIREPAWATAVTVALVGVLGARMHVAARSSLARSSGD